MAGLASNTSIDRVSAARDSGTHFPGHLHVLPGDLNAFRKPTTTNPAEPQYISNHVWNEALLKAQSAHTATRRSGRQTLTRYKHAARVQETEEGKAAVRPCRHCAPYKRTYVCRVYQDASSSGLLSCGCCLSCGNPGCCAGEEKKYIGEEAGSLREYMDEIKKQYNNFIEHEEERSAASEQRPTLLEDRCETLLNAIRTQFEERLRAIEDHFQDLEQRHRALEDHSQNRSERLTAVEKRFNTLDRLTWQEDASLHSSYVPLYRHRLSPCSDPAKHTRIASTLEALSKDRPADP